MKQDELELELVPTEIRDDKLAKLAEVVNRLKMLNDKWDLLDEIKRRKK